MSCRVTIGLYASTEETRARRGEAIPDPGPGAGGGLSVLRRGRGGRGGGDRLRAQSRRRQPGGVRRGHLRPTLRALGLPVERPARRRRARRKRNGCPGPGFERIPYRVLLMSELVTVPDLK